MRLRGVPTSKTVTISVNSFRDGMNGAIEQNVLPFSYARELINLDSSDGALKSGIGVGAVKDEDGQSAVAARLAEIDSIEQLYHFRRVDENGDRADFLIAYSQGDLIAVDYFNPQNSNRLIWSGLQSPPISINYNLNSEDVIIFSRSSGSMIVWNGVDNAYAVGDAPAITSMALHYERLFATSNKQEQNTVWFSDDLDPTNWSLSLSEAGFIQMTDERGAALKVVSFLDYVYVFREYGIARISGYGDQTQFLVSQLSCQTGKIFPNTVTLVGDKILFLAEDGLYSFNGLSTSKIMPNINQYFVGANNSGAVAVAGEGKWYLLCKMMLEDALEVATETSVVLEYDLEKKKVILGKGTGIVSLCAMRLPSGSKVLAVVDGSKVDVCPNLSLDAIENAIYVGEINHSGTVFGHSLMGVWKSAWTDIGYSNAAKVVRKVSIDTGGKSLSLKMLTDRGSVLLYLGTCNKTTQTNLVALRGNKIRFILSGEAKNFYASNLKLELNLVTR